MKLPKIIIILLIILLNIAPAKAQINEGDTMSFWSVTYVDWPPLAGTPQHRIQATCDKAGDYCYIFRESTLSPFPQADIDTLASRFDKHFVPQLTAVYGPIPDALDNDPRMFILIFDEPNWCGYWDPAQQMTDNFVFDTWGSHSSGHEIIYVAADCFSGAPGIVAHEFGHALHWVQDHSPEPPSNPVSYWEDAWIDEGFSTFAAIYLTENIFEHDVFDGQAFFTDDPDIPLIYFSNYNQVKLWTLYMFEHYGLNYISALISNQLNGIAGMDSALRQISAPATFNEAFRDWSITNYLDDSVYNGGKYSYAHYNFDPCAVTANHFTFPTGICTRTVNPFGADYINFFSPYANPIAIYFSSDSNSKFLLAAIKINLSTETVTSVEYIAPDQSGHALVNADSLGMAYTKLALVVCNVDSSMHEGETASYSYYTTSLASVGDFGKAPLISISPNPVKNNLTVKLGLPEDVIVKIQDMLGKEVYHAKASGDNIHIYTSMLPKGNYMLEISGKSGRASQKFTKE